MLFFGEVEIYRFLGYLRWMVMFGLVDDLVVVGLLLN